MENKRVFTSSVVQQQCREILGSMLMGGPDIVILSYKKPMAVMIPFRDYEAITNTLDNLRQEEKNDSQD